MKGEYYLTNHCGFVNALRRTIIADLPRWAPDSVEFTKNTSCQTDEFIAHRIGLIPFRKCGNGSEMSLSVKGRTVMSSDFKGPGFEPVHEIEVIEIENDQEVECKVFYKCKPGSEHARYKMCAGVGMQELKNNMYKLSFETIDEKQPNDVVIEALEILEKKIDDALESLSTQI
tara:strand:+ start:244 stop:762 length:519 start_codon:yes stop_codon:yes gene_type:complete